MLELVKDKSNEELGALKRGGHDPKKVFAAFSEAVSHQGQPTVVLAHTVKGYGIGEEVEAANVSHQKKELKDTSLVHYKKQIDLPLTDEEAQDLKFFKPTKGSEEEKFIHANREKLGGYLPSREPIDHSLEIPPLSHFSKLLEDGGKKETSTTMGYVRFLTALLKVESVSKYLVPILSDEGRTFGMEGLFRQMGIYSPEGQRYKPQDAETLAFYKEAINGQILQEGINEAGAMASWIAAGSAHGNFGLPMIPMFIFYSMFGFQRVADLIWAGADSRARGFLLGATSGRTTLNGEGLQHQDGNSLLVAGTFPTCFSYDPSFSYELVVIMREGLKRMYQDNEDIFYYLTLTNQNTLNPAMPEGSEEGILQGIYNVTPKKKGKKVIQLLASGAIFQEAMEASEILKEEFQIESTLFSVTSVNQLAREGSETLHWNRLNPMKPARVPFVRKMLDEKQPIIFATDYVRAYSEQLRKYVSGQGMIVLGTDGFGRSDTRRKLREYFEVNARWIVVAALYQLSKEGEIEPKVVEEAIKRYNFNPEKVLPLHC